FCEDVRTVRPEIVFGADLIAGFPTETEEMFENSLRLIEECGLTWLHVFPYSARSGTPASRMPQVEKRLRKERAARLRRVGEACVAEHLKSQVGLDHRVLMERPRMGRTEGFAEVHFTDDRPIGTVVETRIIGTAANTLLA
ncbi:MAG: tRNA (N(6)-L-threonylcarbamoyladenosine(37)-C(2))-methylthiotransferase MtaB, partial [Pseudomonadota bacterium]